LGLETTVNREALAKQSVELVQSWLKDAKGNAESSSAEARLSALLKDPNGLELTLAFAGIQIPRTIDPYRFSQGGIPLAARDSRILFSRSVSMGCQKPA